MKNKYFLTFAFAFASVALIAQTTVWKHEGEPADWDATPDSLYWTNGNPVITQKTVFNVPTMGNCLVTTDSAVCGQLVLGDNNPMGGWLVIKSGGVLTSGAEGSTSWAGVSYNRSAFMKVEAGGTFICNHRFHVGMLAALSDTMSSILTVEGTVDVRSNVFSIDHNGWSGQKATCYLKQDAIIMCPRFAIGPNGLLDIDGGTLVIEGIRDSLMNAYVTEGKITAMGGLDVPTVALMDNGCDTFTVVTSSGSPAYTVPPRETTVVDVVVGSEDHTTLETAVIAAELADDLAGCGPFTVFAPTDAAFAALPDGVLDGLLADPTGALASVLLYHVVAGDVMSGDLTNGQEITTLEGGILTVTLSEGKVLINDAEVTAPDITTDNGVVHVIDGVLTYEGLSVSERTKETFSMYPNPATDLITLSERSDVKIYSITGQVVMSVQNVSQLNVETLKSGIYFVEANANGQKFVNKLLIQ